MLINASTDTFAMFSRIHLMFNSNHYSTKRYLTAYQVVTFAAPVLKKYTETSFYADEYYIWNESIFAETVLLHITFKYIVYRNTAQ